MLMHERYDSLMARLNRLVDKYRITTIVLVAVLVAGPGYLRQERAIDSAERAIARAEEAIELSNVQRAEARVNACEGDRRFALGHNGLVQYLADVPRATPRTEEEQALVDDYLEKNLVPVRECTPKAIESFYAADPSDG